MIDNVKRILNRNNETITETTMKWYIQQRLILKKYRNEFPSFWNNITYPITSQAIKQDMDSFMQL